MTVNYCDSCGKRIKEWFSFNTPVSLPKECYKNLIHHYQLCKECVEKMNTGPQLAVGDTDENK